jgi:hypothetical protein
MDCVEIIEVPLRAVSLTASVCLLLSNLWPVLLSSTVAVLLWLAARVIVVVPTLTVRLVIFGFALALTASSFPFLNVSTTSRASVM